jgi:hypothetical protein
MNHRIMYIEDKSGGITGPARIGRVSFSKTGATLYYAGHAFQSQKGRGFKSNYFETESKAEFWISGPRKDGLDRLYGGTVEIDEDVREEYWVNVRCLPENKHLTSFTSPGKNK